MWIFFTISIFFIARLLASKINHPFVNPFIVCMLVIISTLIFFEVSYEDVYFPQNKWINLLLEPAVVVMAYPLYRQLNAIKKHWKIIVCSCAIASILSMLFSGLVATFMQIDPTLTASLMGKSVTTPIAIEVSLMLEGSPSIAALMVLIAGLFGSIAAYPLYKWLNITHPIARGVTMGSVSHAMGTATCMEKSQQDAAFSSLALITCGILTPLIAPSIFHFCFWLQSLV